MPIITISRGSRSGGTRLAKGLKERLGYPVLSREDAFAETARRFNVSQDEMEKGIYMPANVFERFTHRKERYLLAMQATVGNLFEDGNGIYHGVAGQFLFHGVCNVFKVRIVAPMDYRINATMTDLGLSREEAIRYIHAADDRRCKWVRQLFSMDITDPDLYDLIVNLEHMSIEAAADMIADILSKEEYQPTPKCIREFRDFALQKRVHAELFFNSPFHSAIVEIVAKDGVVGLSGGKAFVASRTLLADYVSRIRGVKKVVTDAGEVQSIDASMDSDMTMTSLDSKARDVMLPPMSYPHVPYWVSIREAIVAISASAVKLEDGYITLPRYILVVDEEEHLVGMVSRRELLRGLVPQLKQQQESEAHIRELVPFGGHMPADLFIGWTSFFTQNALDHAEEPVRSVMAPVKGAVQVEDSLSTVISSMLEHGVDLAPVLDGKRVAGVVMMTNIFDIIAQFVMEHGGRGPGAVSGGSRGGGGHE